MTEPLEQAAGQPDRQGAFHYWQRFSTASRSDKDAPAPDGGDLAALRLGAGRPPGSVPAMWPFYRELPKAGAVVSTRLRAEHHVLTLFGFHQQSQRLAMNVPQLSIGSSLRSLKDRGVYSEDGLDRRFTAAATTDSVDEVVVLLRGLITQLRHEQIGTDYELLFRHLVAWQRPDGRARTRRRWGSDYFRFQPSAKN